MLDEKIQKKILELQKEYPDPRSALIPALHLAQSQFGYLPRGIQNEVAYLFNIDPSEVNSVVTFYDMFFEEPVGRHIIHVCKNISCMLNGSDDLLKNLCHKLKISPNETTEDGTFSVFPSECLAACDRAPMLLVDDQVIGPVKEKDLDEILSKAESQRRHSSTDNLGDSDHA